MVDWPTEINPKLKTFDRFGYRIDEVDFHPSYHHMMSLGMQYGVHSSCLEDR